MRVEKLFQLLFFVCVNSRSLKKKKEEEEENDHLRELSELHKSPKQTHFVFNLSYKLNCKHHHFI